MSNLTKSGSAVQVAEWSKRITFELIDGRWAARFEIRPGQPIVTTRDLFLLSRLLRVRQREEARKYQLNQRTLISSTSRKSESHG